MPQPIQQDGQAIQHFATAHKAIATEAAITATSSATGDTCIATDAADYNAGLYDVLIGAPYLTIGTTNLDLELWLDAVFNQTITGHMAASVARPGWTWRSRLSIAAGVHTLTVKGFVDAGTGKFGAGNGATGNAPNALLSVYPA